MTILLIKLESKIPSNVDCLLPTLQLVGFLQHKIDTVKGYHSHKIEFAC